MSAPWLVVAIGNPSRGDDALGPLVAERLRDGGWGAGDEVEIVERYQLQIEDMLLLEGRRAVLFIDAQRGLDAAQGIALAAVEPGCRPLGPAAVVGAFTHALAPGVLLALHDRVLGHVTPPAWLLALPGARWALGAALSPLGARSLERAVIAATGWLRDRAAGPPVRCDGDVEESAPPTCSTASPSPCCAPRSTASPPASCVRASGPTPSPSPAS